MALLLVSFLVVLLSQAHRGQGYREVKWYDKLIRPTINVVIDNMFDIPLKVECHSENERTGFKFIQPGDTFVSKFHISTIIFGGPPVYCYLQWGSYWRDFKAYDPWESDRNSLHYFINETRLYQNKYGKISEYVEPVY